VDDWRSEVGRRDVLTDEECRALFGAPEDRDAMVKVYTLSRADLDLVQARRSDANRLGFAVHWPCFVIRASRPLKSRRRNA
jgi:hypothetical protein